MSLRIHWSLLLVGAGAVPAQTTWIVDLQNRPGTNFTDLPPAVAAAGPGDVLRVRHSRFPYYSAATLTRSVTILCETYSGYPTRCAGLTITGLPSGNVVVIRSLQADTCVVQLAAGPVVLEDSRFTSLIVEDTAHMVLRRCGVGPINPTVFRRSSLFVERSEFLAWPNNLGYSWTLGRPEVLAENCWIGSSATGWNGISGNHGLHCSGGTQQATPALELRSTPLVAGRGSFFSGGFVQVGPGCANPAICFGSIQGTGNITIDPSCSTGCASIGLRREVPLLATDTAVRGVATTVLCDASAGSFAILAVSEGVTTPLPTGYGDLWIDPQTFFVLAAAAVPQSVPLPIPTFLSVGTILTVQAAVLLPDGTITLTLPSFPAVGL